MRRFVASTLACALLVGACTASESATPGPGGGADAAAGAPAGQGSDQAGGHERPAYEGPDEPVRLVTLGDAYTHGTDTAAPRRDSWPAQLVESLERDDLNLWLWNLAEPSKSSLEVLDEQLGQVASLKPDVVTVQVGVNDIIDVEDDGSRDDWYRDNLTRIFDELRTILPADHIFAITTPDHTLTEWGDAYGPREAGSAAVATLNGILAEVAGEHDITTIDIGQVNARVADDASLVIGDGPYPTAKQYAGWVEVIGPHIRRALLGSQP